MSYHLEGRLLEVCNCNVLCPCWVGEDPDNGTCDSMLAWHFDKGEINGVDMSGRTVAAVTHIPGNVLAGNWRVAMYVDEGTSPGQQELLLALYGGKLGGPVADLAKLIGEVVSVEKTPIGFEVNEGHGTLRVGEVAMAELEPYRGPHGGTTTLTDSIFSTVPGSPAFVGKASRFTARNEKLGVDLALSGNNAIQSTFVFHA